MTVIRVFPRRTSATPDDSLVRINCGPGFFDEADEIHISVVFSWDKKRAEELAYQWETVAPVKIGGPAYGYTGEIFEPGKYIKHGYTITSRGCPNGCWFCCDRKKTIVEFNEIPLGYNHLTSNLLACSDQYIKRVFESCHEAKKQFRKPIEFTGGLEAARLEDWHVDMLREIKPKQMFFAYDTPNDLHPLIDAGKRLMQAGWLPPKSHHLRAYILCGYEGDTFQQAETRVEQTIKAGFMPMAMVYRGHDGVKAEGWGKWQRVRANPTIAASEFDKIWRR